MEAAVFFGCRSADIRGGTSSDRWRSEGCRDQCRDWMDVFGCFEPARKIRAPDGVPVLSEGIGSAGTADEPIRMQRIRRQGIPIAKIFPACVLSVFAQAVDSGRDSNKLMKLLHKNSDFFR